MDKKKILSDVKNILVVNSNNQIGDVLITLPMYAKLKDKFPGSKITFVAAPTNYPIPLFEINPFIDKVLTYDKSSLGAILNFYKKLRSKKYEIGIAQSTIKLSRTSHIINFLSGAKIRVGVESIDGEKNKAAYLLNVKKEFNWKGKHQSERSLELIDQLFDEVQNNNNNHSKYSDVAKILFSKEDERTTQVFISGLKKEYELLVGVHPGAGKKENIWNTDNFISLLDKIHQKKKIAVIITMGSLDTEIVKKVSAGLEKLDIKFLTEKDLNIKQLAALIDCLDLFITNDTGPMHIAGATDVNQISLFGPTDSNEWAPKGKNKFRIKSPTDNINDISIEEVMKVVDKFL